MSSFSSKAMSDSSVLCGPRRIVPTGPTPPTLDKHFDFLEWSPDGNLLLIGTSDLNSRAWGGSIWLFDTEETRNAESEKGWYPHAGKCVVGASLDCGVSVGRFLRCSDRFVVGCDSGAIQINSVKKYAELPTSNGSIVGEASLTEHNDMVLDVDDLGGDGLHFVSCSQDKSIKVWDLEALLATHTFNPAHAQSVTSIRARPTQSSCFASCSRDGSALLWDTRDELPASSVLKSNGIGLTSLAWANDNSLLVGGVNGQVSLIDIRNTSEIKKLQLENRPTFSMRAIPSCTGLIAVCQDHSKVSVVDCEKETPEIIYTDDSHEDFARALSWHPNKLSLWSCGWDSKVTCHQIKRESNGVS
ncbi:methylosome protein 50 [Frankliniella occidentalis]|uniref:Methylosome protein 50 n=1 Tax=Frankliniella occidentalis TaxID=133901 RepID=A0A6J1SF29_FRAOC|nr:methylosome protein 50 [Frankliniella occidentalis]